ncbi:MAG: division/cell wall cluster transcriptional repressor MraZ [Pseudomonadota bacterium]
MFRGVATLNLDSKGRLAVPSRHREFLLSYCGGRLVITADPSKCLLIYPLPDWEPIERKLNSLSSFNPQTRSLQRLLVGNAGDAELDSAGRILVAPPLRQFAGLEKSVVLVGQGNKFELWDEEKWSQQMSEALVFRDGGIPPELEGFSL